MIGCIVLWMAAVAAGLSLWIRGYLTGKEEPAAVYRERFGGDQRRQLLVLCGYIGWNAGLAGVAAAFVYRHASGWFAIMEQLVMFTVFAAAAGVDHLIHKIPNMLILAGFLIRVILFIPESVCQPEEWLQPVVGRVISMLAVFFLLLVCSVLSHGGLGMGDVKLIAVEAFACGVDAALYTLIFALLFGVIAAVAFVVPSKKGGKETFALGPFFYIGYVISIFLGVF